MKTVSKTNAKYIDEQSLILDGFRLARRIYASGFRPNYIAGIWRGGSAVGIVVQECLQYLGVETDHIAIRTSYQGMDNYAEMIHSPDTIGVHGLEYLEDRLEFDDRLLLVDDVFSSGYSIEAVKSRLKCKLRRNYPHDVRAAAVWHRPVAERSSPHYYVNATEDWLVLPYELSGLSLAELRTCKPWAAAILEMVYIQAATD